MKKSVVFCHGYKGFKDWGPWDLVAQYFVNRGFVFLKFNFSHNGVDPDSPMDFNDLDGFSQNNLTTELNDLGVVLDWLENKELDGESGLVEDLSLIGHSRGGGIAVLKACEDRRIKRLATWAAVSDFGDRFPQGDEMLRWKEEGVFHVRNGRTGQDMPHLYQYYEDYRKNKMRLDIASACKNLNRPHLIVHGDRDEAVHLTEARRLKEWSKKSRTQLLPGATHTFGGTHPWTSEILPDDLRKACKHTCNFFYEKEPT